ncbi:MAG: RES family NAD+ phosphorylase [Gemmatimonadetes bacterium]|nr:RES family NAD+ phosphorylase [Gemmatimonadota bacterium]MYB98458.1 RES family NAD+ phosphorylase [Gemmatimonadota bacterium]MYI45899.1 RES family NAD+ phosphorylase [Gemmatimonadota bacterium]
MATAHRAKTTVSTSDSESPEAARPLPGVSPQPIRTRRARLPAGWRDTPPRPESQAIGDDWAGSGEHLLLRVPSVVVPEESNVLVNPAHPEASEVGVSASRSFSYDLRLLDHVRSP